MPVDGSNGKREVAAKEKKKKNREKAKRKGKKEERSARSAIIITGDGDTGQKYGAAAARSTPGQLGEGLVASCLNQR